MPPKNNKFKVHPSRDNQHKNSADNGISNKNIRKVIGAGGSPTRSATDPPAVKNFNIELDSETLELMKDICKLVNPLPGRKIGLSQTQFIKNAIQEKIDREHPLRNK